MREAGLEVNRERLCVCWRHFRLTQRESEFTGSPITSRDR